MSQEPRIADSGAVAVGGGSVTISGSVAAGRDVFIEQLTVLMSDQAPSPGALTVPGPAADVCPFPGLDPFRAADAPYFYGRDADASTLAAMCRPGELVAVIGSSGSGKSSLLSAAVVPALEAGDDDRPRVLPVVVRPGRSPVRLLAERLARLIPDSSATELAGRIGANPSVLPFLSDLAARTLDRPLIWVVDQFEEVFDPGLPADERRAVLEGLRPGRRSGVLLALRSDFYPHLDAAPDLAALVASRQHRLTPLGDDALREIVIRPAERARLRVEPGLADQIVRDSRRSGGALPFVAMALQETWRRRSNGWLTIAGYVAGGGVSGAIQQAADAAWAEVAEADRPTARRMLARMTNAADGTAPTRRRCPADEFVTLLDEEAVVLRVLERMVRARILTMDAPAATDQPHDRPHDQPAARAVPTVEIAHEAVLTAWPLLRDWLATDRRARRLQADLTQAAALWRQGGEDPAFLYTGARLAALEDAGPDLVPNVAETGFLRASQRLARRARRRGRLLVVLPAGLVVAVVVAGLAVSQQRATVRAKTLSDALQLAAEARAAAPGSRDLAALLAAEAHRTQPNPTTWATLVDILADSEAPVAWLRPDPAAVTAVGPRFAGPDRVAVARTDGSLEIRSAVDGAPVGRSGTGPPIVDLDVSAGATLTADSTGRLALHDGSDRPTLQLRAGTRTWDVALDAAHGLIVAAVSDGTIHRWWYRQTADGASRVTRSRTDPIAASSVVIDRAGGVVASTLAGSLQYLPGGGARRPPVQLAADRSLAGQLLTRLVITRAGRLVALDGTSLSAWTLGSGGQSGPGRVRLRNHARVAYPQGTALAAAPDGTVMTGTDAGDLTRWSVSSTPARQGSLSGGGSGRVTALATDGRRVVAGTEQGIAVIWDLTGRTPPGRHDIPIAAEPVRATVAADGRLAVGTDEGAIVYRSPEAASGRREPGQAGTPFVSWADGRLVTGRDDGAVTADGRVLLPGREAALAGIAAGGGRLAVAWKDGRVTVVDGGRSTTLPGSGASSESVAVSPDGRRVAAGTSQADGDVVLLWDLRRPGPPRRLRGHSLFVSALAFSPDGRELASGSDDQTIAVWSTATGRRTAVLSGHRDTVRALAWSPDGRALASTGDEGSIRLWDSASGRQVGAPIAVSDTTLLSLSATRDGRLVVAGYGVLALEPFTPSAWRALACAYPGRPLTAAEIARYLPDRSTRSAACVAAAVR